MEDSREVRTCCYAFCKNLSVESIDTEYRSWYKEIIFYFADERGYGSLKYICADKSVVVTSKITGIDEHVGNRLIHELSHIVRFV